MREDGAPNLPANSCGDCGLCCKLMGVTALQKPTGKWCRRFSKAGGCAIYDERPDDCRVFNCLWLLTEALDEGWKPTTAGFVLHSERDGARLIVECDAARPHDWRREPYETTLRRWAAAPGQEVLVFAGSRGVRLGDPDALVRRV
ncbi:MAG: YkgJ family cysteine cluster protein [Brevundimonas sp.]|uniref:YkgJ family cysteine cluster protein n=1 Tax=Brevundimonas sp. TaxID=1871086 RepID=UPI00271D5B6F|nr:YkgJ family cysteine cluster protein [Brevundimonas sp.]MDO9586527.1 YkgJ family cysteine cluster protein [Brevundimonas sp.]MDP3369092.1 YkgJ family cysteine cluster protein [Brevundimonas sp.]MDP3656294.1 YkgJ family cysteine cluster protein [Brevundimonas sp.]MDZ4112660.1 YkgJ family cysteine cluster protein [Brevundimonas sp.]